MKTFDKILNDLNDRNVKFVSFIVETEDGKLQIISYDHNGNVNNITEKLNALQIYEPSLNDNTMMSVLGISTKQ